MTNWDIIMKNLPLIDTCIECQCKKNGSMTFSADFRSDLYVILAEYPNLNEIYEQGHLNAFISGIIHNQLFSTTSKFWRTYSRFDTRTDEITDEQLNIPNE